MGGGKVKHTVESVNAFVAEKYNGKCLNIEILRKEETAIARIGHFQCADGHEWKAPIGRIVGIQQSWCLECRKVTIKDANKVAALKGGQCLSQVMKDPFDKLEWQCDKKHVWKASYRKVSTTTWCPKCAKDRIRNDKNSAIDLAALFGGQSLTPYTTNNVQMQWRCKNGHEWSNTYAIVKQGIWCSVCADDTHRQLYNDKANEIAISRGGKCLSNFIDSISPMQWECEKSHQWTTTFKSIVKTWCPRCVYDNMRCTQDQVNEVALLKGGKCLSVYEGIDAKMLWECAKLHQWSTSFNSIKNNSWCPTCAIDARKIDIMEIDAFILQKGGKRISEYINAATSMELECGSGHKFRARFQSLKNKGNWCPTCFDIKHRVNQSKIDKILLERGGKCHSKYVDTKTPMEWECKNAHKWNALYDNVKRGTWCPYCPNKSESECREIFEQLFGAPFPNIRPEWLRNPEGNKLELDGYNEELKVAWEFNGIQHYEIDEWHGGTEEKLKKQQLHDAIKVRECAKRGIDLIVISYKLEKWKDKLDYIYTMLYSMYPQVQDRLAPLWR
jgi:hypothetical protein